MINHQLSYELDSRLDNLKRLGLIILQEDQTLEEEFNRFNWPESVRLYHSRIKSLPEVTTESLTTLERELETATRLFPREMALDVIGFACTSATTVIGFDPIAKQINRVKPQAAVTTPATALIAYCRANAITKIGLLTPYGQDVNQSMVGYLKKAGIAVTAMASFNQPQEDKVAAISEASTFKAVIDLAAGDCQLIFASCTNLRSFSILKQAFHQTNKTILSSNAVLIWHMLLLINYPIASEFYDLID